MRPEFSEAEARTLVSEYYGMEGQFKPLPSYSDQNFRVSSAQGTFVFKIANALEPESVLDFQQKALQHVRQHSALKLPRVIAATDGSTLNQAAGKSSHHWIWMVDFLPGQFISDLTSHSPQLLVNLGRYMGELDRTLATFTHDAMFRTLPWDLKQAHHLFDLLDHIKDSTNRTLARHFLERMDEHIEAHSNDLRCTVIHNDANDNNVLVSDDQYQIDGIIDFGDMLYSYTVGELAIATAYMILDKDDPLQVASQVLNGYHAIYPLNEAEISVLFDLICLRLSNSVCMSAKERSLAPDNEYLAVSEQPAWQALNKLKNIEPAAATDFFFQTIHHTSSDIQLPKG